MSFLGVYQIGFGGVQNLMKMGKTKKPVGFKKKTDGIFYWFRFISYFGLIVAFFPFFIYLFYDGTIDQKASKI